MKMTLSLFVKFTMVGVLAGLTILSSLIYPLGGAPLASGPAAQPSPRPPLNSNGEGGGGGDNGGAGNTASAISGLVTDLSTNQPGAGIEVVVNGQIVRTDSLGQYSITGLPAGLYIISPDLQGQGTPAQPPIPVNLNGRNTVTVDLNYYSQTPPTPTPSPSTPTPLPAPPPKKSGLLPPAGADFSYRPLLLLGLGLGLIALGGFLIYKKLKSTAR